MGCLLKLTLQTLERLGANDAQREELTRAALRILAEADYRLAPPHHAMQVARAISAGLSCPDPFAELKHSINARVLELVPALTERIQASADPFRLAAKLSLAGNVVDFGIPRPFDLEATIREVLAAEPAIDAIELLRNQVARATQILFLADNAGELVLDRLFIEQFPRLEAVTVVVRGGPALNDVTLEDAEQVGLCERVRVIDSGIALAGTCLEQSRPELRQAFERADLIIAKGQGNFETLHEQLGYPLFFLFMVKCSVVSAHLGLPEGACLVASVDSLAHRCATSQ